MSINLTQHFVYETDSLDGFEKVLDTMVRVCMHNEKPSQYSRLFVTTNRPVCFNDGKRWIEKYQNFSKPSFLHVCSVGDYKSDIQEGDQTFESYSELVKNVMAHLKNADGKNFFTNCGEGYGPAFNHFDGSVGAGFRLNQRSSGGWDYLDVSLCHVYYGK